MLTALLRLCFAAALAAGVAATPLEVAHADDTVSTDDGWVVGRDTSHHDGGGHSSSGERGGSGSDAPDSPDHPCVQVRTVTGMMGCEGDPPDHNAHLGFTPPSEAEVRVALHLPDPTPHFGPDPARNEWHLLAVGYPIWLWTSPTTSLSATATHDGLTMSLTADWTSTTFDMGDGHQLSCTKTTEYPKHPDRYGTPSPTCGYTYQKRSKPGHDYTVIATTHWTVTWATAGRTGTLTTTYSGDRTLAIGELQALIKG